MRQAEKLTMRVIGTSRIIHYYESVGSTNDVAYKLAEEGEPEGAVVIAETQTAGKGRLGRKWISPKKRGIYMTIILRPRMEIRCFPVIVLIAALSIVKAIKRICAVDAKIKWPNDVMIDGKKVCGILAEVKASPDRLDFLVLGIGINVNAESSELPHGATSLKIETAQDVDRDVLVNGLLEEFENDYSRFKQEGFLSLREECKKESLILGKLVRVSEHNRFTGGVAHDIDESGALLIKTADGILKKIFSGDVMLVTG